MLKALFNGIIELLCKIAFVYVIFVYGIPLYIKFLTNMLG